MTEPQYRWAPLFPTCPACQEIVSWRLRHPGIPIERRDEVRIEAAGDKRHRHGKKPPQQRWQRRSERVQAG